MYIIILKQQDGTEVGVGSMPNGNGLKNLVCELAKQHLGKYTLINDGCLKAIGIEGKSIEIRYIK